MIELFLNRIISKTRKSTQTNIGQVRVGRCGLKKYESLEHFNQILYLYNAGVSVGITAVDFDVTDQLQVKS